MKILSVAGIIILILGVASLTFAEEAKRTAKVDEEWISAELDTLLSVEDPRATESGSQAVLNVDVEGDIANLETRENHQFELTELEMDEYTVSHSTLLELGLENVLTEAQKLHSESERFEVKAPTTVVGIRGSVSEVKGEMAEGD